MSTSAIQRAKPAAILNAAVATSQIFAELNSNPLIPLILICPGSNRLDGKPFKVRASGGVTTAGASNVTVTLYAAAAVPANPFIPASWAAIAASGATAVATTSAGFNIEVELMVDAVSGKLQGNGYSNVNNALVANAAITNALSGLNPATEPVLVFALGITFSAASATNTARLLDFSLDA